MVVVSSILQGAARCFEWICCIWWIFSGRQPQLDFRILSNSTEKKCGLDVFLLHKNKQKMSATLGVLVIGLVVWLFIFFSSV